MGVLRGSCLRQTLSFPHDGGTAPAYEAAAEFHPPYTLILPHEDDDQAAAGRQVSVFGDVPIVEFLDLHFIVNRVVDGMAANSHLQIEESEPLEDRAEA